MGTITDHINKLIESFHLERYNNIVYITFRHGNKRTKQQQFIINMDTGRFEFAFGMLTDDTCVDKNFNNGDKIEAKIKGENILFFLNGVILIKNYSISGNFKKFLQEE